MSRVATGSLMAVVGLLGLGSCAELGVPAESFADDTAITTKITSIRLDSGAGSVRVHRGTATSVHREVHYSGNRPGGTSRVDGEQLVLEACRVRHCEADYDVIVPDRVKVVGQTESGAVTVDAGVAGDVDVTAASGALTITDVPGPVAARSDSGKITLASIGGAVTVQTGSAAVSLDKVAGAVSAKVDSGGVTGAGIGGDCDVQVGSGTVALSLLNPRSVRAVTDSGDIDLTVPNAAYQVTAANDGGPVTTGVPNTTGAPRKLDARAGAGGIKITTT
ncbi:DUF4097 family beta strand repeat-containing protein [Amycolatopsis sp. CA-230715]|uniref:DUF4097 family beta strand repeat-containing protein n=1 Tax=Amycolatopsis sp. CA-230715 TaxID=2745196 RepID=UPI001C023854|nr:DUF4097 family beta strand repeat-containing protein [Amycolatopsis sp. CA-230715]QWF85961.1 hypothetical protein HUW46_09442 [Amycolatopsis sp. CA-230715]